MNLNDVNRAFVYNRGLVWNDNIQAEMARKQKEQADIIQAERAKRKQQSLVNSINSHFKNLEKFVKDVFSEPSELSQFLIEKVLSMPGGRLITRQKFVDDKTKNEEFPTLVPEVTLSVTTGHLEKEYFDTIDLIRIESLSGEKSEYLIALIVPRDSAFGKKPRTDLRDIELIVYEHKYQNHGFESDEEAHLSHPPANFELRNTLKSLKDLNVFCGIILKRYQYLITLK